MKRLMGAACDKVKISELGRAIKTAGPRRSVSADVVAGGRLELVDPIGIEPTTS